MKIKLEKLRQALLDTIIELGSAILYLVSFCLFHVTVFKWSKIAGMLCISIFLLKLIEKYKFEE